MSAPAAASEAGAGAAPPGTRLESLDVFRGATVALMILVNNPGSWSHLYGPLAHAPWHGWTPTDLVFPFFLFAVGNALALVLPRLRQQGSAAFWRKVLQRTLIIFTIGLALNAAPFVRWDATGQLASIDMATLRIMGVLQRIALCFGFAAVIVWFFGRRGALVGSALLLVGYWAACVAFGQPGDVYGIEGWFGTAIDRALLGPAHLYRGEGVPFDPEGLMSTVPAIAQVLLGWWVGETLRLHGRPNRRLVLRLALTALPLLLAALAWQTVMPINKKIWTSSYVLLSTALAIAVLALLVLLIEVRGGGRADRRGFGRVGAAATRVFSAFGRNALFVFVLSGLVPRFLALIRWPDDHAPWTSPLPWLHAHVFAPLARALGSDDPRLGSLLYALAMVAAYGLVAVWMDRRRIYVRV